MFGKTFWIRFIFVWVVVILVGSFLDFSLLITIVGGVVGNAVWAIFDLFVGEIKQKDEHEQKIQDLIREMGSSVNAVAIRATEELYRLGMLDDGSLNGKDFHGADLRGSRFLRGSVLQQTNFNQAHLEGTELGSIHFEEAKMFGVHLEGASMMGVRLERAQLGRAHLEGAKLWNANLRGANFNRANLKGASLKWADIRGASFDHALFDGNTVLPDGLYWERREDLYRYTDPE